ncbi:Ig-like domain-containing protein [Paracidobacterium acidisoli]|nr:Ig-like domain-containing protein [Paracidobacterium acidisoli]MBT9331040.1 Ig-like domain-containing protein [Paracidobacterium acidisoli]
MLIYRLFLRIVALSLCMLLAGGDLLPASAQSTAPPKSLQIVILDGEGALNNIKLRTAHEPIVQVQDENHKPVAGALVFFLLPDSGPGGSFLNGAKSLQVTTDAEGKAVAHGFVSNRATGQFQIQVRAQYGDLKAQNSISQQNISERSGSHASQTGHPILKWVLISGAVAGAGVAIGIAATQGGHSTTIIPGTPTVGAP